MKILYKDDKKEKWQSHEFHGRFELLDANKNVNISFDGLGASKEKAAEEFMRQVVAIISELNIIIYELENVDLATLLEIQESKQASA